MVTKIDLSEFVIVVDNGRNVINCGNCATYEDFVEINFSYHILTSPLIYIFGISRDFPIPTILSLWLTFLL